MDIREAYQKLNSSFKKTLIYHVGIDAGFFTEYTYMIHAMLYCLVNNIQFKLYSADANFSFDKGWRDYFLPFCEEVNDSFHHKYNLHAIPSWKIIIQRSWKEKRIDLLKWKVKTLLYNRYGNYKAKKIYGTPIYLNHHIHFDPNQLYVIPQLGIKGDYIHAFNKMVDITWHLNQEVSEESKRLIQSLNLPEQYAGCQIRGGDKITEVNLYSTDFITSKITKTSYNKIFILTDDYRLYEEMQHVPNKKLQYYTLCTPEEKGYVNKNFIETNRNSKRKQMFRFLTSIQILLHAQTFIGSITTGPSLFLIKRLYPHIYPLDYPLEGIKEILTLPIAERGKKAETYLMQQKQ